MTLRAQRLEKLYPALDGDQRIAAVVDSVHRSGTPDPLLFRNIPERQGSLFWHRVGLLRAAHTQLGWYLTYVDALVGQVTLRYSSWLICRMWAIEAERVLWHLAAHTDPLTDSAEDQEARTEMCARLQRRIDSVELAADEADQTISLDNLPRQLFAALVTEFAARWQEVRLGEMAVEAEVGDALMQEFQAGAGTREEVLVVAGKRARPSVSITCRASSSPRS